MRNKWLAAGLVLVTAQKLFGGPQLAAGADEPKSANDSAKKTEPWKTEDFVYTESAGAIRLSRDAKWAVWVKSALVRAEIPKAATAIPATRATTTIFRWVERSAE